MKHYFTLITLIVSACSGFLDGDAESAQDVARRELRQQVVHFLNYDPADKSVLDALVYFNPNTQSNRERGDTLLLETLWSVVDERGLQQISRITIRENYELRAVEVTASVLSSSR